jgi:hypothetical protein
MGRGVVGMLGEAWASSGRWSEFVRGRVVRTT